MGTCNVQTLGVRQHFAVVLPNMQHNLRLCLLGRLTSTHGAQPQITHPEFTVADDSPLQLAKVISMLHKLSL